MITWAMLKALFMEKPPPMQVTYAAHEELSDAGLTMGSLYIGRQGSGKTSALARHLVEYFDAHPQEAIFVLDWSGDLSNKILAQFCQRSYGERQKVAHRLVYDEPGHPEWILPRPELTEAYGGTFEDEIERVKDNLNGLYKNPSQEAVIMAGVAINKTFPEIYRLLTSIKNTYGETWQVTEAEYLIENPKKMAEALASFGALLPEGSKKYLQDQIVNIDKDERNKRTYILMELFGWIKTAYMRARLGYPRPAWTPKEAIKRGQMVIVNGSRMVNHPTARNYVFTQDWTLIKSELNRRTPHNLNDRPVTVVLDEVKSLLKVPAFAEDVGEISPVYRSRGVQLYIVIQALSQLTEELERNIWLLGNLIAFGLENKEDCGKLAYQLNKYQPTTTKLPAQRVDQNPVTESEQGQDRLGADWIWGLDDRQCLVKRYMDERHRDKKIRYVHRTKNLPARPLLIPVDEFKEQLLKDRGMRIWDALGVVDRRKIDVPPPPPPTGVKPGFTS